MRLIRWLRAWFAVQVAKDRLRDTCPHQPIGLCRDCEMDDLGNRAW